MGGKPVAGPVLPLVVCTAVLDCPVHAPREPPALRGGGWRGRKVSDEANSLGKVSGCGRTGRVAAGEGVGCDDVFSGSDYGDLLPAGVWR